MKQTIIILGATIVFTLFYGCETKITRNEEVFSDYPIHLIPFSDVRLTDQFWSKKIQTNHEVTIPIAVQKSAESGRIKNFKIAGNLEEGKFCSVYPFDDSDIYKILEAASYSIQAIPDPAIEAMMDSLITFVEKAQEPDGYLYTNRTIGKNVHEWAGNKRWEFVHELSHELYNLGHLYEAAVAHYQATGKRSLLDIAVKSADLVDREFGEGKILDYPGHQEIEIGLVKLFRATGEQRYLDLAKFFLDIRGQEGIGNPKMYDQSHLPVIDQREAVGHSVRAAYMWTAMTDIAAITGDDSYMKAINAIWQDVVGSKLYINGGIGAAGNHEGFSVPYDLPNMSAYCETCAGVGNAIWNHRMFLMTGDSKFIDVLERTMYNNILDGVSLSGDHFFYPNPLESNGQHERSEWFGCACCPPNIARFLPSMPGYIYAQRSEEIFINLYVSSNITFTVDNAELTVKQTSDYPWEGNVNVFISTVSPVKATLRFRIPGYVMNRPVPGELYTYASRSGLQPEFKLNGEAIDPTPDKNGYVSITHEWATNDQVEIHFPFEVSTIKARTEVKEDLNKIAIERGPLVYCAEWPDTESQHVLNAVIDPSAEWKVQPSDKLGGIVELVGVTRHTKKTLDGGIEILGEEALTLIPYHLWNNRGPGEMRIWLPVAAKSSRPIPAPTIAYRSNKRTSVNSRYLNAIADQVWPESSDDQRNPYLHWWPEKDTTEWVRFDLEKAETISNMKVYWYDDGPDGGCRIPKSWKVQYKNGSEWQEVSAEGYPVSKDEINEVSFEPVTTNSIRLLVELPKEYAAGIHEVEIN